MFAQQRGVGRVHSKNTASRSLLQADLAKALESPFPTWLIQDERSGPRGGPVDPSQREGDSILLLKSGPIRSRHTCVSMHLKSYHFPKFACGYIHLKSYHLPKFAYRYAHLKSYHLPKFACRYTHLKSYHLPKFAHGYTHTHTHTHTHTQHIFHENQQALHILRTQLGSVCI